MLTTCVALGLGLILRQELVLTRSSSHDLERLAEFGTMTPNGDGTILLILRSGVQPRDVVAPLQNMQVRFTVLPPRAIGSARTAAEANAMRGRLARALDEYGRLPAGVRLPDADGSRFRPRGLTSQETHLDWVETRSYPSGRFNWDAVALAYQAKRRMTSGGDIGGPWVNIGPYNLAVAEQQGFGAPPVNGRINDIAYDPANPNRIFAASARGGLWRSTDGGVNWTPLSESWERMETSVVKTNPGLANRVYVGTGDQPLGVVTSIGLMVSTDNGATWAARGVAQFDQKYIADILVSTNNASTLIVAPGGSSKLHRTTDEGVTWSTPLNQNANWTDLDSAVVTGGVRHFYAAGNSGTTMLLYRSTDDGATWNPIALPTNGVEGDRIVIACSKRNASVVYVAYTQSRRVFKRTVAGLWVEISGNLAMISPDWAQGSYNNGLLCFIRTGPAGTNDCLVNLNTDSYVTDIADAQGFAGDQWIPVANSYENNAKVHVDHQSMIQHPSNPSTFLFASDGGIARVQYDGIANVFTFTQLSRLLNAALVSRISVDPLAQDGVLAGLQDNGMGQCAQDTGNWLNLASGDLGHSAISPTVPGKQYIMPPNFGQPNDPNKSGYLIGTDDGWATAFKSTVSSFGDKRRPNPPIAMSPDGVYAYVGTDYLYRFDTTAKVWSSRLGGQLLSPSGHVRHLAVAPSNGQVIYVATNKGELWRTSDGGSTFTPIFTGNPGLPNESFGFVSVDPTNWRRVLVAIESSGNTAKLYECLDTTAALRVWTAKNGALLGQQLPNAAANAIGRHPQDPSNTWFVATDNGVYHTRNAGKTWMDLTPVGAFPNVRVTDVKVQATTGLIYVSTYGRGVWRRPLPKLLQLSP